MSSTTTLTTFPVSEIYGPVAQGEGALIGTPTIFLRLGGCDYRCSWCDSLYAVLPKHSFEWERLSPEQIIKKLYALGTAVSHITLTGGNPAIHAKAGVLVDALQKEGYTVAVETQGTLAPKWLLNVNYLTASPKPPSSGNPTSQAVFEAFCTQMLYHILHKTMSMKIVVFDDADYEYARNMHRAFNNIDCFLQVGTNQNPDEFSPFVLLQQFAELQEKALRDPLMAKVRVLPQMHSVLYGLKRGI